MLGDLLREQPALAVGQVVASAGVDAALREGSPALVLDLLTALRRFVAGDWPAGAPEDAGLNDAAAASGDRLLAVFPARGGPSAVLWIVADAVPDFGRPGSPRTVTMLWPDEY
ncbi:MAG: hypothetical protein OXI79_14815 [Gammaproteobacteria bacterium]|nr:hypothetical protein [Gammaproteobacteria bacterium]